ncbi:unnamed protein product, partial [Urochloa humidicola]
GKIDRFLLGRVVAEGAEDARGVQARGAVGRLAGEVEVGDLGVVAVEEEDVAGAHVPVHDGRLHLLVQVLEPPRRAVRDLHPLRPAQHRPRRRVLHALLACTNVIFCCCC